jgi:DNA repair exonuclease SbcCD ATPase subunit
VEHLEKMKEQYQSELDDIVKEIDKLKEEKSQFHSKKEKVQQKVSEFQDQIQEAKVTKQKLEGMETSLKQYKESLNNLKLEELPNPEFEENITKTQERKKSEVEKYAKLKEYSDDLETCKFMLGEEGVKSFVVKRLLSMLNASIQQYINDLGLSIRCKFDEYFDEQMTNDKGKEICYWNLSGAEGRTIDLACAWAFKDIKRKISGVSSNLEILDEVIDNGWDSVGYDNLINVIKHRIERDKLAIYVISHRTETNKHIDSDKVVMLEMDGGITRRI